MSTSSKSSGLPDAERGGEDQRQRQRDPKLVHFGAKFVECMNGLIFVQIFSAAKYIQLSDIGRQGGVGVCVGGKKVKLNISNNILK